MELKTLPVGFSNFEVLRKMDMLYVDKTELIYRLASSKGCYFLNRPRCFGKTLLISTFESLFKNGLREFKGLAIETLWGEKNSFNVVRLDFLSVRVDEDPKRFSKDLKDLLLTKFSLVGFNFQPDKRKGLYHQLSEWLAHQLPQSLVVLIDEYDAPLLNCIRSPKLLKKIEEELLCLYSLFKERPEVIRFFFVAGKTNLGKAKIFSLINGFQDISLDPAYATLLGFTPEEVKENFSRYLTHISILVGRKKTLFEDLELMYGGYRFEKSGQQKVFAPISLLNYFRSPENGFEHYWFTSGGNILNSYFETNLFNKLEGFDKTQTVPLSVLKDTTCLSQSTESSLLVQLGYLTIKGFNNENVEVGYPNLELKQSLAALYCRSSLKGNSHAMAGAARLAGSLSAGNPEDVYQCINHIFSAFTDLNRYIKNEGDITNFLQLFFLGLKLPVLKREIGAGVNEAGGG